MRTRVPSFGQTFFLIKSVLLKKFAFNVVYRVLMIENVSGDVEGCARAKGVLDVSVRPRSQ